MRKKVLLVVSVALLSVAYVNAQFKFGARAGVNFTTIYGSDADESKFKPGLQIGAVGDYALNDALSIQPGILLAQQGWQYKEGKAKMRINLNYIQVPINVQYKMDLGGPNLLLNAGPYLGFGVNGKTKMWDDDGKKVDLDKDQSKIEFGSGAGKLNALDLGLGLGAGLQFDNIQVGLGVNFGLAKLNENSKMMNTGIALTATYFFGN